MRHKEEFPRKENAPDSPALRNLDEMLEDLKAGKIGINQPDGESGNASEPGGAPGETGSPDGAADTGGGPDSQAVTDGAADSPADTGGAAPGTKADASRRSRKKEPFNLKKEILDWFLVLVAAAVLAFFIDHFIIANSQIPTGSMENTIMPGDRVIGLRLSYLFGEPERGDIAIFVYPDDEARGITTYYVKRVIGLPGDTIDIVDGQVYLNGSDTPLDEPYLSEPMEPEAPMHFEVPEDSYFMMGDNRNHSNDSRRWINTYVSRDKLIAKVFFQYFPSLRWLDS